MKTLLLAIAVVTLAGCESVLAVAGTTYEWRDAPPGAQSYIVVNDPLPTSGDLVPLSSVAAAVHSPGTAAHSEDPVLTMTSGTSGSFGASRVVAYLDGAYVFTAAREGYAPARTTLAFGTRPAAVPDSLSTSPYRRAFEKGHYFVTHVVLVPRRD